jgi:hypothetical protein
MGSGVSAPQPEAFTADDCAALTAGFLDEVLPPTSSFALLFSLILPARTRPGSDASPRTGAGTRPHWKMCALLATRSARRVFFQARTVRGE